MFETEEKKGNTRKASGTFWDTIHQKGCPFAVSSTNLKDQTQGGGTTTRKAEERKNDFIMGLNGRQWRGHVQIAKAKISDMRGNPEVRGDWPEGEDGKTTTPSKYFMRGGGCGTAKRSTEHL